ncbi:MAG: hypothetical protein ABH842_01105 [Candidatus Micrarchaeota archaeon]
MQKFKPSEVREAALDRIKKIQPLCETILGRKLDANVKVRVHGRLVTGFMFDIWYPCKKAFTVPFSDVASEDLFTRTARVLFSPVLFTLRRIYEILYLDFGARSGHAITRDNVIYILSRTKTKPNTAEFDYFIAHELIHLLTPEVEQYYGNIGTTISEGLATYYGEKVAQLIHPELNVIGDIEARAPYICGYNFIKAIAEITGQDPFKVMSNTPVIETEKGHEYLYRLRALMATA